MGEDDEEEEKTPCFSKQGSRGKNSGVILCVTLETLLSSPEPVSSHAPSHVEDKSLRWTPQVALDLMCVTREQMGPCASEDTDTFLEGSLLSHWNHSHFVLCNV